jgi:hypothetical protein
VEAQGLTSRAQAGRRKGRLQAGADGDVVVLEPLGARWGSPSASEIV